MAKYYVEGTAGKRRFVRVVEAESEKLAREKALSLLGSECGLKRTAIKIAKAEKENTR
jgi:ribosomal protein L20A (L18A)